MTFLWSREYLAMLARARDADEAAAYLRDAELISRLASPPLVAGDGIIPELVAAAGDDCSHADAPEPARVYVPDRDEVITLPCADPLGWRACASCGLGDHMTRPAPPGAVCDYCSELAQIRAGRWPSECEHGPGYEYPACYAPRDWALARAVAIAVILAATLIAVAWAAGVPT